MDLRGTRALEAAGVAVSMLLGLAGVSEAGPVRVSLGGGLVVTQAGTVDGVLVGPIMPVLEAAGAWASYDGSDGHLFCVAPDGTRLEGRRGSRKLVVDGGTRDCGTPLRERGSRLCGPLVDIAQAIGLAAQWDGATEELRLSHRLVQVDACAADEAAVVHMRLSGPGTATLHTLREPDRAYIDLPGITWVGGSEALDLGGAGGLERVRWALFQEWPPVARVVADLEAGAEASLAQVADRVYMLTVRAGAERGRRGARRLSGTCIVIDPSAGGPDLGVRGSSIAEKTVALDVAVRLAAALENAGADAVLTRSGDRAVPVEARVRAARAVPHADLVLTIRCGRSNDPDRQGVTTAYSAPEGRALAEGLQRAVAQGLRAANLGVVQAPDACLADTGAPTVSCTVGFLTSPEEGRRLASLEYRERAGLALLEGIAACLGGD